LRRFLGSRPLAGRLRAAIAARVRRVDAPIMIRGSRSVWELGEDEACTGATTGVTTLVIGSAITTEGYEQMTRQLLSEVVCQPDAPFQRASKAKKFPATVILAGTSSVADQRLDPLADTTASFENRAFPSPSTALKLTVVSGPIRLHCASHEIGTFKASD